MVEFLMAKDLAIAKQFTGEDFSGQLARNLQATLIVDPLKSYGFSVWDTYLGRCWRKRNAATLTRFPHTATLQNRRRWAFVRS